LDECSLEYKAHLEKTYESRSWQGSIPHSKVN
jgi:hypothetical protein